MISLDLQRKRLNALRFEYNPNEMYVRDNGKVEETFSNISQLVRLLVPMEFSQLGEEMDRCAKIERAHMLNPKIAIPRGKYVLLCRKLLEIPEDSSSQETLPSDSPPPNYHAISRHLRKHPFNLKIGIVI